MFRLLRMGLVIGVTVMIGVLYVGTAGRASSEISTAALASDRSSVFTHTVFLPAVSHGFDASLGVPPFGVQMYGTLNASTGITYAEDIGASWVRVPVSWKSVEPTDVSPDGYHWASADASIVKAVQKGLHLVATINNAPDWAATYTNGPIDKVDLGEFAEFVGSLVERYDGDGLDDAPGSPIVNDWEFYNEPDGGNEFRARYGNGYWGPYGSKYAEMLTRVYPVIKESNPNARVVFGGMAYDWFEDQGGPFVREFLDDVLKAGGGQYFDLMNFHAYPAFRTSWSPQGPGLLQKLEYIRNKMHTYGVDKPIIITETGWHSNNPPDFPSSPEIQARYVTELFTQGMAGRAPIVMWWELLEPGSYYWDNGLLDYSRLPKPSYFAYQAIVSELSTAHFDRVLTGKEAGSSDMEAYRFVDYVHKRTVYVAWLDPIDTSNVQALYLVAPWATVRDIYGNSRVVNDGDDGTLDSRVTLQVNSQPMYVEVTQ